MISIICEIKKKQKNTSIKQKKIRFVVTRGRNLEVEQLDGSDQKVLKIHKYWGCNVQQLTLLFGMFESCWRVRGSLVGCRLWDRIESDTTEAT